MLEYHQTVMVVTQPAVPASRERPTYEQEITSLMSSIANIRVFRGLRGVQDYWPSDQIKELLAVQHIAIFPRAVKNALAKTECSLPPPLSETGSSPPDVRTVRERFCARRAK